MKENIKALLVQARHDPLDALRMVLEEQSIGILTARNCAEAALALWSDSPPHLVFTEVQLADGAWTDVLTLSAKAAAPVNVIVVAPTTAVPISTGLEVALKVLPAPSFSSRFSLAFSKSGVKPKSF